MTTPYERIQAYIDYRIKMRGIDPDVIHGINGNDLKLTISDLRQLLQAVKQSEQTITLPREMDEDLWYIVGGALGAQSPEQCNRAEPLWDKLVQRADSDAKRKAQI